MLRSKLHYNILNENIVLIIQCFCSAGVGRTGTFIGLDVLCDMGKDYGFVDVFKCVDDLRKQRVNMVQTKVYCIVYLTLI
jgi:protein tyrosine phosphatase